MCQDITQGNANLIRAWEWLHCNDWDSWMPHVRYSYWSVFKILLKWTLFLQTWFWESVIKKKGWWKDRLVTRNHLSKKWKRSSVITSSQYSTHNLHPLICFYLYAVITPQKAFEWVKSIVMNTFSLS